MWQLIKWVILLRHSVAHDITGLLQQMAPVSDHERCSIATDISSEELTVQCISLIVM